MYVVPDHRNEGTGWRLLEEVYHSLFEQGNRIKTLVLNANELGGNFYIEFDFEKSERESYSTDLGGLRNPSFDLIPFRQA